MSTAPIALIEGDETETDFIENRILNRIESAPWEHFESIDEFRRCDRPAESFDFVISDLLEEYTDDMSRDEVLTQLANSFEGLLNTDTRPRTVVFLTKVPLDYIKDAMERKIDLFSESQRNLGSSLEKSGVRRYNGEDIVILEKPYWKNEEGELKDIDEDNLDTIRSSWQNKLRE